jgi:hypothetical protein
MSARTNSTIASNSPQEPTTLKPNRSQGSGSFGEADGPGKNVYDSLDDYFPGHDLDKPLIETSSVPSLAIPLAHRTPRRTMTESPSVAKLRRRGTKLWDSRVQEVLESDGLESPILATPPTGKS